jgi:hypothetical protein
MTIQNTAKSAPTNRSVSGPFDISEVANRSQYANFGALHIMPQQDVDIRLEVEDGTNRVVAVTLEYQGSSLQLQAFAAPKSEGLWNEIRAELAASIKAQSGVAEEQIGAFGLELQVRIPLQDADGNIVGNRSGRFLGVDGPRWFLRGLIGGAAIHDPTAASQIEAIFRSVAVDRGNDPVPPRDLLSLHVPEGVVTPPRGPSI